MQRGHEQLHMLVRVPICVERSSATVCAPVCFFQLPIPRILGDSKNRVEVLILDLASSLLAFG